MHNNILSAGLDLDFRNIAEWFPEALLVENPDGRTVFVNHLFKALTGFTAAEVEERGGLDALIPEEFRGEFNQMMQQEAGRVELESYFRRADGIMLRILFKRVPFTSTGIPGRGCMVQLTDLTEERRQMDTIRESDERLRFLMSSSSEGIVIHEKGMITDVNDAVLKMLGYTYEQLIGHSIFEFVSANQHDDIRNLISQQLHFVGLREVVDHQGKVRYLEINSKHVRHKGRDLRVLTMRDITDLWEQKKEDQRLIAVIEASPFFIGMMDFSGLRYMNKTARTMLGMNSDTEIQQLRITDVVTRHSAKYLLNEVLPIVFENNYWKGKCQFRKSDATEFTASLIILAHRNPKQDIDFLSFIAEDITDRLLAEQIMEENQERLRYFMEESLEAIVIHDSGTIIDCNTAACKMFAYDQPEMMGRDIITLLDTSFRKEIREQLRRRETMDEEWTGVRKDGSRFDIEVYSRAHSYKGKEVRVASILDISSRKKTERALKSSELMLNAAIRGTNIGIWEWNLVTSEVKFNETWSKIKGLHSENVPQTFEEWKDTIHADDREGFLETLKSHLYGLSPMVHYVYRLANGGGPLMVLEIKGKLVRDEHKMPVKIVGTMVDITERQMMEDALRNSQAQLSALIENREESIWSVDTQMRLIKFNASIAGICRELFGFELKPGVAMTANLSEEEAETWNARYRRSLNGESFTTVDRFIMQEREMFVEFSLNPIIIEDQTIVGVSVMGRDITQQIQFEKSLQSAKEMAEEANRTKSQFLANISHEIRTPMNGIIGFSDLLMQTKINNRQKEYLEIVRSSADSLLVLINDLLDISKIEAGKLELVKRPFDLGKLLKKIIKSFKAKAREQKLVITLDLDKKLPRLVLGDEMRLQQVFVNLIGNAIKFSERGRISVQLKLQLSPAGQIILESIVEDEGIGIPMEKQDSIFEAFNQVGDPFTSKYGGTGLGLSIARRLVHLMQGTIGVKSEPGKGSEFRFTVVLDLPPQVSISGKH